MLAKAGVRLPAVLGSWTCDITWLERLLVPGLLTLEPLLKHPYVLDVDDAIWLSGPLGAPALKRIAREAELVLAGNRYLAEWLGDHAKAVRIVPTAVDTQVIRPREKPKEKNPFVVGWSGTSSNYPSLQSIERPLNRFLKQYDAILLIVSDAPPLLKGIPYDKVTYLRWDPGMEREVFSEMDVGLMPLLPTEWNRGKCSFKMLQYMAAGIPVVVTPWGMNAEVLDLGPIGLGAWEEAEWYEALRQLYKNPQKAHIMGQAGRAVAEHHFSRERVTQEIGQIFRSIA